MKVTDIRTVLVLILIVSCFVAADPLTNQIGDFRLGLDWRNFSEKIQAKRLSLRLTEDRSDGMRILKSSDASLYFWMKSDRLVGIRGYHARFDGENLQAGVTEQELRNLLGQPKRIEVIEAQEDVGSAKNLYYTDGQSTLLVGLSSGKPRKKSGWIVTNFYLYREAWFFSPFGI